MRHLSTFFAAATAAALAGGLLAAPPLTTIRDTIYKADGSRFTGTVIIEWRSFDASDTSFIGRHRLQTDVVDGLLNIKLVPTTTAASTAWYQVRYVSNGSLQFYEAWAVSPSGTPLRVRDVRVADPLLGPIQSQVVNVEIGDVSGLQEELNTRPRQSIVYLPSRAAVINGEGELESATGAPEDCIRVDGSSGPCGSGGSGGSAAVGTFVDGETPSGVVDGANAVFGLAGAPSPAGSLLLYRNGILQKAALDYSLTGSSIQFQTGSKPQPGDVLLASYRTAGAGATVPQVLCATVGAATGAAALTSLGVCTIPASMLNNGSRIEVSFDFGHTGTASGAQFQIKWGSTVLIDRSASSGVSLMTGRLTAAAHSGQIQWSSQSWGTSLSLETGAGSAADSLGSGIVVDFRGALDAASADSMELRGFTVTAYPAH
ncbi:MAG: hypothetical protein R2729_13755 [Bryobacteraceae bacterium]